MKPQNQTIPEYKDPRIPEVFFQQIKSRSPPNSPRKYSEHLTKRFAIGFSIGGAEPQGVSKTSFLPGASIQNANNQALLRIFEEEGIELV